MTKKEFEPKKDEILHDYVERLARLTKMNEQQREAMQAVQKYSYIIGSNNMYEIMTKTTR